MKKTQQGNVMAILLAVLVIAFIVWVGFYIRDHRKNGDLSSSTASSQNSSGAAGLSNGSSNQDLNSDLQNINSGLNQGNQNLQDSNNSLNDQQLPITE